jgi:hypothetical protein
MYPEEKPIPFPIAAEGPFYRLQILLRLMAEEHPHTGRRILVALAVTWLPLALLWWWQGEATHRAAAAVRSASLFTHLATYARFFVTVPLLIAAETAVRPRLEHALRHAVVSGVIPPFQQARYFEMLISALQRRKSKLAEAVILALAFLAAQIAIMFARAGHRPSWIFTDSSLTWAGTWYAYVSLPFLQFLIFRWLYRLMIWWKVMHAMAHLDLSIQPAHPDGRGGLAFVGDSVQAFAILAFAFSATAAGAVADYILNEGRSIFELKGFVAGGSAFILLLFLIPLLFFCGPSFRAKDEAIFRYEALAENLWQAFEHKWLGDGPRPVSDPLAEPDFSALADYGSVVKGVREMWIVPWTKEGLLPLVVAVGLPFVLVLAAVLPVEELLKGVLHVFMGGAE